MPFSTIIIFDAQNNVKPENHFLLNFQRRLICKSSEVEERFSVPHFPQPLSQLELENPRSFLQTRRATKMAAIEIARKTKIVCQSNIIEFESLKA